MEILRLTAISFTYEATNPNLVHAI